MLCSWAKLLFNQAALKLQMEMNLEQPSKGLLIAHVAKPKQGKTLDL